MTNIELQNSKVLGDYKNPYIVAELNTSHFGDLQKAKEMIDAAKSSGCDCVKFQSWSEDTLYSETFYLKNPMARRFIRKFSFSAPELLSLSNYCKDVDIDFASTPYSNNEVDFLVDKCNVPYLKVASMDLVNLDLLAHMARKEVPIILSTGMATLDEIEISVAMIKKEGNSRVCILHCVSLYPTKNEDMRLLNILGLREKFPEYAIGFSDHSEGVELAVAATALGAALIEKHFTLDKSKIGMDNQMAIESEDLKAMVSACRKVSQALGARERLVSAAEIQQRDVMRRSLVSARKILKGEILREGDIQFKRPGNGMSLSSLPAILGKTAVKDIDFDVLIQESDLE